MDISFGFSSMHNIRCNNDMRYYANMKKRLASFFKTTKRILHENRRILILIWSVSPVLDEPTSNLDPVSEENIYNVINTHKGDKTIIMVSHRLSGAMIADKNVAIDDGMIVGVGTHLELIKDCEIYSKMFNLQANRYLQKV